MINLSKLGPVQPVLACCAGALVLNCIIENPKIFDLECLILAGNLAVHYATLLVGEALKMKPYKVMYIQCATLSVFHIAVATAVVAAGIFAPGTVVGLTAWHLACYVLPVYRNARREHGIFHTEMNLIPMIHQRHNFTESELVRIVDQHVDRFFDQYGDPMELAIARSQNDYQSNRVPDCIDFANLYYHYQLEARDMLMDSKNKELRIYSRKKMEQMEESLQSVDRLAIFNLIDNIQKTSEQEIVFKQVGEYEFHPSLEKESLNFITKYNLFDKLRQLKENIQSLTMQDLRWRVILQKQLTNSSLENENLMQSNQPNILEQKKKFDLLFNEITAMYHDFNTTVISASNTGIQWMDVFVFSESDSEEEN